ncbi:MAG: protein-L-isoaspartate O-methyltransferase, partial [Nitrospinae bacterium RIFCSPLOWO2_12_FULL_47_7]
GDHPLPIGENQTISQPYVVGLMTEALRLTGKERILEIGTGSGYQTAVLAELAERVFTIERIKSIGMAAQKRLEKLGYSNIAFKIFDGTYGWRDQGPFDGILIAAAAPDIPQALIEQLKDSGRLVAPVGDKNDQRMVVMTRNGSRTTQQTLGGCSFVPLIGKFGWPEDS